MGGKVQSQSRGKEFGRARAFVKGTPRRDGGRGLALFCCFPSPPPAALQSRRRSREGGGEGSARHLRDVSLLDATGNCLPTDRSLTDDQKHIVSPPPPHCRRRCLYPSHWPAGCFPGSNNEETQGGEKDHAARVSNRGEDAGCIAIITSTASVCFFLFVFSPPVLLFTLVGVLYFLAHCRF